LSIQVPALREPIFVCRRGSERIGNIGSRSLSITAPLLEALKVRFLHPHPFRPALIGLEDHREPVRGKRRDRFLPYGGPGPFFPAIPPFLEVPRQKDDQVKKKIDEDIKQRFSLSVSKSLL
jgi:hypothetical protein